MRTPQWLDQRSLALHRLVAEKVRQDPALFEEVKDTLDRWSKIVCANSQPYVREWQRLVALGMEECLAVATEDSERGAAMRQASPFCGVLTDEERWEFFLAWARDSGASDQKIEELRQWLLDADEMFRAGLLGAIKTAAK